MVKENLQTGVEGEVYRLDKRFLWGLIIVAVLVGIYFVAFDKTTSSLQLGDDLGDELGRVRARVNGLSVYESDVSQVKTVLEKQTGKQVDDSVALDRAVTDTLVIEEAEKKGIEVSKKEAEKQLSDLLAKEGTTLEQLKESFKASGRDYDETIEDYRKIVLIERLANKVTQDIVVTDEEVKEYYENNKASLFSNSEIIPPFDQVKDKLKLAMKQKKMQEEFGKFVLELKANAEIEYVTLEG